MITNIKQFKKINENKIDKNNLPEKVELDKLSILELVEMFSEIQLVTREGYGGENEYGYIPEYIEKRLYNECVVLEGS